MASKQNQLVQTLLDQNQQLNATQLANSLGVSVRTVHNYINAVNAQYQDAIVSTPTGYRIAPAMAQQMLHQSPSDIPQNAQDRCTYILNRLVQKGGSLNLYDLCDEIYISATTFHGLMGKMRRLTREYDLSLAVSGDTVTLTGSERNKRRLLSGLLYHESASAFTSTDSLQAAFPSIDIEKIRADVMDVLNENHYFINDYSLLNLLLHIAIAINRVQNGCVYTEAPSTMHPLDPQNERLAQELTERLDRNFNIRFSAAEQYEMALLLVSRTSMLDYAAITPDNIADYIGSACRFAAAFQHRSAVRAARGGRRDFREAVGALLDGRLCRFGRLFAAVAQAQQRAGYKEQHPGHDEEIDDGRDERAVGKHRRAGRLGLFERGVGVAVQGDEQLGEVEPAGEQADERHDDVVDERGDDGVERCADDHADGKVKRVALYGKGAEFPKGFLHGVLLVP